MSFHYQQRVEVWQGDAKGWVAGVADYLSPDGDAVKVRLPGASELEIWVPPFYIRPLEES